MGAAPVYRDDLAARLRRELADVPTVLRLLGLQGRKSSGSYVVACPWHDEKTPSCSVRLGDRGEVVAHCFGCRQGGTVVDLAAAVLGYSLPRDTHVVCVELARLAGVDIGETTAPKQTAPTKAKPLQPKRVEPPTPSSTLSLDDFTPVADALLAGSPLDSSLAVSLLAVGLLDEAKRDGWGELPVDYRLSGESARWASEAGFDVEDLAATRLAGSLSSTFSSTAVSWCVSGGRLTHAEHRLLIPWRDPTGRVVNVQRRFAPHTGREQPPKGTPKYLWPKSALYQPPTLYAYGVDARELADASELWLCEGAFDVLAVRAINRGALVPRRLAALGIPGVGAWAKYRASVLPFVEGRDVLVALDDDDAGDGAVELVVDDLRAAKVRSARRVRPRAGAKDWAEQRATQVKA